MDGIRSILGYDDDVVAVCITTQWHGFMHN